MVKRKNLESRASDLCAEFLEQRDKGKEPDLEALLARDPEVAHLVREILETEEALFPSLERRRIGDFVIKRKIARGGMGVLYEARQVSLGRAVALKILPGVDAALDAESRRRFNREMAVLADLEHPHIVPIISAGRIEGRPYFVMPLLKGETLAEHLESELCQNSGGINENQAVLWMYQIALSLSYIHSKRIVHRDIKPSNIFIVAESAEVRLLDFGLARSSEFSVLTMTGQSLGTPAYMSPEQIRGGPERIGPKTDIYLLGATFFEALTLHRPFHAKDSESLNQAILKDPPPLLREMRKDVSKDLESILMHCLNKDPDKRYADAEALLSELDRLQKGKPILTRPPSTLKRHYGRLRSAMKRYPISVFSVMLAGAIGIFLLLQFLSGNLTSSPEDYDIFEINFARNINPTNFSTVTSIRSSTGKTLYPFLEGVSVQRGWKHQQNLIKPARLTVSNDTHELVMVHSAFHGNNENDGFLNVCAYGYGDPDESRLLWEMLEANPTKEELIKNLYESGFQVCNLVIAPDLLETGYDVAVLILGSINSEGFPDKTAVLIVDHQGIIQGKHISNGMIGWFKETISVCEIDESKTGENLKELLLVGYDVHSEEKLYLLVIALKPNPNNLKCGELKLKIPLSTGYPDFDKSLLHRTMNRIIVEGDYRLHLNHWFKLENSAFAYLGFSFYLRYYYIRYDREKSCFEFLFVDYDDSIKDLLPQHDLRIEDLPFDGEALEALRQQSLCSKDEW